LSSLSAFSCATVSSPVRGSAHQHHGHAVVDQRGVDAAAFDDDGVAGTAGRQQRRADRAGSVQEVDGDRRRRARHAVYPGIAAIPQPAAGRLYRDVALHAGIQGQDPGRGRAAAGFDDAALKCKRQHGGQHVAAIGRRVDRVRFGLQLGEEKVEVDAGRGAWTYDADLAGQRVGAAQAVDLAPVRRAHHGQQHAVARRPVWRQIGFKEKRTARRAAAHQHAGQGEQVGIEVVWNSHGRAVVWLGAA
jgi:hypothetical protein